MGSEFDEVEIHVVKVGTGGLACARQHHRALSSTGIDWRDGRWMRRAGGQDGNSPGFRIRPVVEIATGLRFLTPGCWCPSSRVQRATARQAATLRDRLTAPFPMLRPCTPKAASAPSAPSCAGGLGPSVVVGVRATNGYVAAGAVAAAATMHVLVDDLVTGARGLAGHADTASLFNIADRGVKPVRFEGISTV